MLELGKKSDILHKNLSKVINNSDIDKVFIKGKNTLTTYKNLAKKKRGNIFQQEEDVDFTLNKIISNPKLFSLNNQAASITQGVQIQVPGSGDSPVTFKDAALKLQVTPNIIGDGNVLLDVQVNNDTPDRTNPGAVGINTMEINTKLLVADGDIVVIGGIKKNDISNASESVPGINKLPIVGKLFQGKTNSDTMSELLVFIAPRVL